MTASSANAKFANGEKPGNKNTTAETRRASKPLMEKRRRARINESLAVLKSLIVDSQRVEGQKHAKLEKADILEMTVAHLQSVKKSDEQKFLEGFEECFSETTRFLEKSKTTTGIVDKLTDHLKTFKQNLDLPTSFSEAQPSQLLPPPNNVTGTSVSRGGRSPSSTLVEKEDSVKLLSQPPTTTTIESNLDPNSTLPTTTFSLNVPRLKREPSLSPNSNKGGKMMKRGSSSTHSHSSSTTCLSPSFSNDSNNNNFVNSGEGLDGFRRGRLSPPSPTTNNLIVMEHQGYPHPGSVESFERIRPHSGHLKISTQITSSPVPRHSPMGLDNVGMMHPTHMRNANNGNAYVLNLSTQSVNVNNSSFANYCNNNVTSPGGGGGGSGGRDEEPMEDDYCEPLDFSKPLNLSKHEVMYRMSEDDQGRTWRPW